ncbi:heavy metal translocating P-type ATPase [Halomonas garicola]|uniref:heavy metal translocating P-type ATPase n=1 Tax=Halomonas garicola TaxID=1690008 RepID=UPI00289B5BCF|nr:cation-translocating P-type ATPase [Halomonas garicola]
MTKRRRDREEAAEALDALEGDGQALLSIDGLWCPSCAAATEQVIQRTPGVTEAGVSFATSTAVVRWDPRQLRLRELARRVARLGYRLGPPLSAAETLARIDRHVERLGIRLAIAAFFGMWTLVLSLVLYIDSGGVAASATGWWIACVAGALAVPVLLFVGLPILLAGWRTLRTGVPGMDTLIGLGVTAAVGLSVWQLSQGSSHVYFDTATMLVGLLTLGRFIETRTLRHATQAIDALKDTLPETAQRLDAAGQSVSVAAETVASGERIRVAAGQRVPLDGIVLEGASRLDRSVLTGESLPAPVASGDYVEAGCVNLASALTLVVDKPVGGRRIDRIGARIAEAAGAKGDTQRLADRVARFIVPVALGLATMTLLGSLAVGFPLEEALLRAVSVLVIACPCAVGIAVPVAYVAAASQAARRGILFRHPAALESMAGIHALMFDKTGTLTEGQLAVDEVHLRGETSLTSDEVLALAAQAEQDVEHVIARALQTAGVPSPSGQASAPQRFERGVRLDASEHGTVLVGSADFLESQGVTCKSEAADEAAPAIRVGVEVAVAGFWVATLWLKDRLRDDAVEAVARLRRGGIECAIVSGDAAPPSLAVARQLGLPDSRVYANCSPEGKAAIVRATRGGVAFVGDGINDGPALAEATVGIAVREAAGPAMTAASVAIAEGGVTRVADAVDAARRAYGVMRQNLVFAVIYNAVGLSLAAFGMIPPVVAVIAMAASSLTVTANASRLAGEG